MNINFIDGVEHLHGNLYKIPFSEIITTDRSEDESEYVFSNPRMLTKKGVETLSDKNLSKDLRENIKVRTLLTPFICRWIKNSEGKMSPQLVGGDRRYRALDYLINKKEMVADPRTCERAAIQADIAYEYVVAQVFNCENDLEASVLSWAENKNRIDLTEGHEIAAVLELRKFDANDDQILEILQKDSKWLHETDELIGSLDDETLNDVIEDRIKRGAAVLLSKIDDLDKRSEVRIGALEKAEKAYEKDTEKLDKQLGSILIKKSRAETKKAIAETISDEKLFEQSQKVLDRVEEREGDIEIKKSKVKPIASAKMVAKAAEEAGVDEFSSKKAGVRTIKKVIQTIQSLIDNDGETFGEDSFIVDVAVLELVKMALENHVLNNSDDFMDTLTGWNDTYSDTPSIPDHTIDETDEDIDEDEDEDIDEDISEDADDIDAVEAESLSDYEKTNPASFEDDEDI